MVKRVRLQDVQKEASQDFAAEDDTGGAYYDPPKGNLQVIPTGSRLLDCVVGPVYGGGWVLGRISNIVGDKSTGKTLLAIEACANFARLYDGPIYYREAEAAFDKDYAANLGLPLDRVAFGEENGPIETVEDMIEDLMQTLATQEKSGSPGLYILDSLDALSDRDEMDPKIDKKTGEIKGSYGTAKAKGMSRMFRQLVRRLERTKTHVMIISQIRDNIGVTFGRKTKRSGGHALDFYASQVVYLAVVSHLDKTIQKVKRDIGVLVKAKCDKNKVGTPFRVCEFPIMFGYGIDDLHANLLWLHEIGRLAEAGAGADLNKALATYAALSDDDYRACVQDVGDMVVRIWNEVEDRFRPKRSKYGDPQ